MTARFSLVEVLQVWLFPQLLNSGFAAHEEGAPDLSNVQEIMHNSSVPASLVVFMSSSSEVSVVILGLFKSI